MEKHKCAHCGLLAIRNNDTGQWEEVDQNQRDTGQEQTRKSGYSSMEIQLARHVTSHPIQLVQFSKPFCLVQVFDLLSEYGEESASTIIASVLQKERVCSSFRKWQLGFTPKEHREMMDREEMLKWQAEREGKDKEWQKGQNRQMVILGAIIGGIFGLITTGLGIWLTYLFTHGGNK